MLTKATLQECCTAWVRVWLPWPPLFQQRMGFVRPCTVVLPPQ